VTQTRKSSPDRKAEILATTLDLAFEVGPDHVTTGRIAARLGLSQPAIYKHFPKKEDIWHAAARTLCARIRNNTRAGMDPAVPPLDNVRHLVLGHLRLVTDTPALPELMVTRDPTGALTDARRDIQAAVTGFRAALVDALTQARSAGHLRADLLAEDAAILVFGIIQSLVLRLIVTRNPAPLLDDGARLLALQLALFENEDAPR